MNSLTNFTSPRMGRRVGESNKTALLATKLAAVVTVLQFTINSVVCVDIFNKINQIGYDTFEKLRTTCLILAGIAFLIAAALYGISKSQRKVEEAWDWMTRVIKFLAIVGAITLIISFVLGLFSDAPSLGDVIKPATSI